MRRWVFKNANENRNSHCRSFVEIWVCKAHSNFGENLNIIIPVIFSRQICENSALQSFFAWYVLHGPRCSTVSVCCSFFFIEFSLCGQLFHFLVTSFCRNRYFYFVNVYFDDLYDGQTWFSDHLYLCYWVVVWSHQQVVKLYQNLLFFFKFVFLYFEIDIS